MNNFSHQDQKNAWEAEHVSPRALLQMDSIEPSGGVVRFFELIRTRGDGFSGLEMGCGKGRNGIWLARQETVTSMKGFDFSETAIAEARRRAHVAGVSRKAEFIVADAAVPWPYPGASFDFVIDCFASTDIESSEGRLFAAREACRTLKPGGFLFVYALSTDDEFHADMIRRFPAKEPHAFYNEAGKFEKVFDETELTALHEDLVLVKTERIEKQAVFFGKEYYCKHFWNVYQKPLT